LWAKAEFEMIGFQIISVAFDLFFHDDSQQNSGVMRIFAVGWPARNVAGGGQPGGSTSKASSQ